MTISQCSSFQLNTKVETWAKNFEILIMLEFHLLFRINLWNPIYIKSCNLLKSPNELPNGVFRWSRIVCIISYFFPENSCCYLPYSWAIINWSISMRRYAMVNETWHFTSFCCEISWIYCTKIAIATKWNAKMLTLQCFFEMYLICIQTKQRKSEKTVLIQFATVHSNRTNWAR